MSGRGGRRGLLSRLLGRAGDGQERDEDCGQMTIAEAADRQRLTVQGQVTILTVNPSSKHRWLEADLADGTGTLTLVWMGRHRIAGVTPGRSLRATGLIAEWGGRRVMFNPGYELLP